MKRQFSLLTLCVTILVCFADATFPVAGVLPPVRKKVIDLCWGAPTVDYLAANASRMEAETALDGVVVRFQGHRPKEDGKYDTIDITQLMGPFRVEYDWYAWAIEAYRNIPLRQLTDNFLYTVVSPGTMKWFSDSDWEAVCHNFQVLAKVAKEAGLKGILFDTEEYATHFWEFATIGDGHSFEECIAKARQRGQEWGRAVFGEFPEIRIFCTYFVSNGSMTTMQKSFMNGVLDVIPSEAMLIEGYEGGGYYARTKENFVQLAADMYNKFPKLIAAENLPRYRNQVKLAIAFYVDALFKFRKGEYWHDIYQPDIGDDPVAFFRRNLYYAFQTTDEYVWLYGEKGSWWSKSSHADEQKTWDEYAPGATDAIRFAKDPMQADVASLKNILYNPKLEELPEKHKSDWSFWLGRGDGKASVKDGICTLTGVIRGSYHQDVPVKPGALYLATAKVRRTPDTKRCLPRVFVAFKTASGTWTNRMNWTTIQATPDENGDWQSVKAIIETPTTAGMISFQLSVEDQEDGESVQFCEPGLYEF